MAAARSFLGKSSYQFLSKERDKSFDSEPIFEFDEADGWSSNRSVSPEYKRSIPRKTVQRGGGGAEKGDRGGAAARSLPVNIPDWSKILRDDSRVSNRGGREEEEDDDDDYEDEGRNGREVGRVHLPPHEYLAKQLERKQIASFSVREGIGRTLKGRDLSRVRDAVWEKTGFED